jgi:DNA-directed RNA polymerase III subunit RPC7
MAFRRGGGRAGARAPAFSFSISDLKPDFSPEELYPTTILPAPEASVARERQAVSQYITLKEEIRDGPLFTGSNTASGRVVVEIEEGFNDGIKRYSDIYVKKRKIGRSADEHPYGIF